CAPLNPTYRSREIAFYLADLKPRALLTMPAFAPAAEEIALALTIPVLHLEPDGTGCAGGVRVKDAGRSPAPPRDRSPQSVALLLHTSGTTARPKLVPLTEANLAASARNIARALRLGPEDLGLNIMPLFHIHGLMASVLATIAAGASVHCTRGFYATEFFA